MERNLKEALKHRRSYYAIEAQSPIPDEKIEEIVRFVLETTPSAFNSQSTRLVLLLGKQHKKFWQIVKDTLQKIISEQAFKATENKINNSFASGYGTVLFLRTKPSLKDYKKLFPYMKANSRNGRNTHRLCISLPHGPCSKMPDSEHHCNITIH